MDNEYDVVIAGAGLAGLTSAAYLCRCGYRTLLCEKSEKTGGLVSTFWHRGFAFDAGIHVFENSGILLPMLKDFGIDIPFTHIPVSIGIGNEWARLESRKNLREYRLMLGSLFPGSETDIERITGEIEKITRYMSALYSTDNPLFLNNEAIHEREGSLPLLLKYLVSARKAERLQEPARSYLLRFTENRSLIDMIAQFLFTDTPAYFALSYFGLYLDYCYPAGGTGVLAERMTEYIRGKGGDIVLQAPIFEVDAKRRQVTTARGETYRYKKLIWAADQKALYSALKTVRPGRMERRRALVAKSSGSDSVLTLFIGVGLDPGYFEAVCGAHTFYTPVKQGLSSLPRWEDAARGGDDALRRWIELYLKRTTYTISCPAVRDASLAPDGKAGVIVSTQFDYRLVKHISDAGWYDAFKETCSAWILDALDASVFPGILHSAEFTLCATPLTFERETGNAQGTIAGWAFTNHPMPVENRLHRITRSVRTPMRNIFQCGHWTFSPSGLPVSILTGRLAARIVHKQLKGNTRLRGGNKVKP